MITGNQIHDSHKVTRTDRKKLIFSLFFFVFENQKTGRILARVDQ